MKKRIFLLFLLATPFLGKASHIVGGEFELVHLQDFQYRLNLILYFDVLNGQPGAKDPSAAVRFFRMRDNAVMLDLVLPLVDESNVDYTQPACSHGELVTRRLIYSNTVTLSPDIFKDAKGYYVAWERCCRNYSITNIFSEDPAFGNTNWAGQTFYLEFPAVVKNGKPFVDSTPRLFPPLNDYACPLKPYYANFAGTDDDGDSLVYSMVTPLNTKSSDALPPNGPRPRPYPDVRWRPPFSLDHILTGSPDLQISPTGFLTVTPPGIQGLFAFAVKVEEYRNKVKIGETRRDFQMLVVDHCARAVAPVVKARQLSDPTFHDSPVNISFPVPVADADRCFQIQVSDADSEAQFDGQEKIKIKAIPLDFTGSVSSVTFSATDATLINGSVATFNVCLPFCPFKTGGHYQLGIVAMDDACAQPLTDTLKVLVYVVPPANSKPQIILPNPNPLSASADEGSNPAPWPFRVTDADNDVLDVSILTNGFELPDAGMTFTQSPQSGGTIDGQLKWDPYCNIYDFTHQTNFKVVIAVEDRDQCNLPNPAKATYDLTVINLPDTDPPNIDSDLTSNPGERVVNLSRRIDETLKFQVMGTTGRPDDNNFLLMRGGGTDFDMFSYGVTYAPLPAAGNKSVNANFEWNIKCAQVNLKVKDTLDFQFVVIDSLSKCHFYKSDTLDVVLKVLPPNNAPPQLTVTNRNSPATVLYNNSINMVLGPTIDLLLTATDADVIPAKDNLRLELVHEEGTVDPKGYSFTAVSGTSPLQAAFTWRPDCTIFEKNIYENEYTFTFRVKDDHCLTAKKDSIDVKLKIKDVDGSDATFIPPNFFSPNGDNINDYFAMEMEDLATGEMKNILPLDNCVSRFEGVRIYNRWGNQVFQSTDRDFKWTGGGESAGVYYYFIRYTKKEYKGSVSLRY